MGKRPEISSGGIIYRIRKGLAEVAIARRRTQSGKTVWCLPKGLIEEGESTEETAIREVREETGLTGRPVKKLGRIQYWYHSKERGRVFKIVYFFLLRYERGRTDDHDYELDEVIWVPVGDALEKLTYRSEREMMERARDEIAKTSC